MDEVEKTWRGMGSEKLEKKMQRRMRSGREMGEEGREERAVRENESLRCLDTQPCTCHRYIIQ